MMRILVVGSITLDFFMSPKRCVDYEYSGKNVMGFYLGDKIRVNKNHQSLGGGSCNVAASLKKLGLDSSCFGKIGNDTNGKNIIKELNKKNINTQYVKELQGNSGFSVIISHESGERVVFFNSGVCDFNDDFNIKVLENFDGICLQHNSAMFKNDKYKKIFTDLKKYLDTTNKFFSWNPGMESLEKGIEEFTNILKNLSVLSLNKEEAEIFTKKKEIKAMFKHIFKIGFQGKCVITDGMKGAFSSDGKKLYFCGVDKNQKRIDTLGAGDAFLSTFNAFLIKGEDIEKSMKYATLNASSVVAYIGAETGLRNENELQEKYKNTNLEFYEKKL